MPVPRSLLRLAAVALAAALAAGHVAYWYLPRERASEPPRTGPLAGIVADARWEATAWVAYPHQNLGALDRVGAGLEPTLEAIAGLLGLEAVELPPFGPFRVPPASAMAVGWRGERDEVEVALDVYPTLRVVARLAGRLAGNPWLAGGRVVTGGRTLDVAWEGELWRVRTAGRAASGGAALSAQGPALALVRLARTAPPLPPGLYRLARGEEELTLATETAPRPAWPLGGDEALVQYDSAGAGARAVAAFRTDGPLDGVPGFALLSTGGTAERSLPGGKLFRLLGLSMRRTDAAGWRVAALDARSLEAGATLVPRLAELGDRHRLAYGLWVDLDSGRGFVDGARRAIDPLGPLVRRQRQFLDDASVVLEALGAFDRLAVVVDSEDGAAAVLHDRP